MKQILSLGVVALVAVSGCGRLGSSALTRDRFNYNNAIAESWKNQLLENVVKIRYADVPVFLSVSSVVSQYEIKGSGSARVSSALAPATFKGSYTERPTISFTPQTGSKFIKSFMTPLPPGIVLSMIETGWPANFIFDISVQAINGLYNRAGGQLEYHAADHEFKDLLASLAFIQRSGVLALSNEEHGGHEEVVLMFRDHPDPEVQSRIASVMQLLRLAPGTTRFRVSPGVCPTEDNEVKIQVRSVLMIMEDLALGVEVPAAHSEDVQSATTPISETADSRPLVRILSANEKPEDTFASIRYRNHWFWIENHDFLSKRAFSFVQLLTNLSQAGQSDRAPVLTIPTGR